MKTKQLAKNGINGHAYHLRNGRAVWDVM
jgi:hypothetical protein